MFGTYSSEPNQISTARRNSTVLYIVLVAAVLLACNGLALAQTSSPQSYPTKRIVDPKTVRRQAPAPVRFVLKPFSIAGSKVEAGLNLLEDSKIHNRLQIMLADPHVRPTIGNLGDGSGFGLGVAFNTAADARWAADVVGSFTDEQIRAAVETGEISDPAAEDYLVKQLIGRRDRIVAAYLDG